MVMHHSKSLIMTTDCALHFAPFLADPGNIFKFVGFGIYADIYEI